MEPEPRAHIVIRIEPIGKPRITRQGKRAQAAQAYYNWANAVRLLAPPHRLPPDPIRLSIYAYFSLPQSWSKKKCREMAGQPHRQKPDWDNVGKALQDTLWHNDQIIADGEVKKRWDDGGGARLEIEVW